MMDTMQTPIMLDDEGLPGEILAQILQGLVHLHKHQIVHHNLKPENVGVYARNPLQLKIIDLGLAVQGNTFAYEQWRPDVRYSAPEMRLDSYHNASVDVWACGIIGLEMIFKEPTVRLAQPQEIRETQIKLDDSEAPIAEAVLAILRYDRAERPTAAEALRLLPGTHEGPQLGHREVSPDDGEAAHNPGLSFLSECAGEREKKPFSKDSGYQTAETRGSRPGSPRRRSKRRMQSSQ